MEIPWNYCKVPKFSDYKKLWCNLPKIYEKRPNLWVFLQKDANGIANSEDTDLGLHCLPRPVCPKTLDHYCGSLEVCDLDKSEY